MSFYKFKIGLGFGFMFFVAFVFLCVEINARLLQDPLVKNSKPAKLATKSLLLSIEKEGARIFIAGERGHILYSDDLGVNWIQSNVPTKVTLTDLYFINNNEGWAVGHDATILHTNDAGLNWEIQYFDPELDQPLMSLIAYKDSKTSQVNIDAVGAYGYFLSSKDNGETWSEKEISSEDAHLNQIIKIQNEKYLIAGEFGYVHKTLSDGTWHFIKTPYEGSFFGLMEPRENEYFAYGLRGTLYYSDDQGQSWKRITTDTTSSLLGGIVLNDGRMVLVGSSGVLLVADDSTNKRFHKHVFPDRKANSDLIQLNETEIMIVGEDGVKKFDLSEIGG